MAAEFVASCKKYNVIPGFYAAVATNAYLNVSGNKMGAGSQLTLAEYQDITLQQLKELWTNYGQIGEIWFDGGIPEAFATNILALFKKLQPSKIASVLAFISTAPPAYPLHVLSAKVKLMRVMTT